jgi:hypothetical protein
MSTETTFNEAMLSQIENTKQENEKNDMSAYIDDT